MLHTQMDQWYHKRGTVFGQQGKCRTGSSCIQQVRGVTGEISIQRYPTGMVYYLGYLTSGQEGHP